MDSSENKYPDFESIADILDESFNALPRSGDDFYCSLWDDKRIRFYDDESDCSFDGLDELNARLSCSAINSRKQLMVVLPDLQCSRVCSPLATAVIMNSVDTLETRSTPGYILYFGTSVGIRRQLGFVWVGDEQLSTIFTQAYGRGASDVAKGQSSALPQVICIYSPLDPIGILKRYNPRWVAIDCGVKGSSPWLSDIARYLCEKRIPAIAWSANPLADVVPHFRDQGWLVFQWPLISCERDRKLASEDPLLFAATGSQKTTAIRPLVIDVTSSNKDLFSHLRDAFRALSFASSHISGRLERDAVMVGWRLLRTLETMLIPVTLFEIEATQHWGVSPVFPLKNAFDRFVESIMSYPGQIAETLSTASAALEWVVDYLASNDPPRWNALLNICIAEADANKRRAVVFPSNAHKTMFIYAILGQLNVTESDLSSLGVSLWSFKEIETLLSHTVPDSTGASSQDQLARLEHSQMIFATVPNRTLAQRMMPFLHFDELLIISYDYQVPTLQRACQYWHDFTSCQLSNNVSLLNELSSCKCSVDMPPPSLRVAFRDPVLVSGKSFTYGSEREDGALWEPLIPEDEVASLFDIADEAVTEIGLSDTEDGPADGSSGELFVDCAIRLTMEDGWTGLFAADQRVNIVSRAGRGPSVRRQYVRSVRAGDTILYIQDSKRQSLLELVISRVHSHPSMQVHLSLINQWHLEVQNGFAVWCTAGRSLEELYAQLADLGSEIASSLTIRGWVTGNTIRPRHAEDLRRLAQVLSLEFTLKHYKRIHQAGDRIHGIHISLGQRLNKWIEQKSGSENNDIIDEATGLTFGDVRDSLILLDVKDVATEKGLFMRHTLGKIFKNERHK